MRKTSQCLKRTCQNADDKPSNSCIIPGVKKWRKRIGYILVGLLLTTAFLAWEGRAGAMVRFVRKAHKPSLNPDFEHLEKLLPQGSPTLGEMYAGLPHPFFNDGEFVREL